MSDSATQELTNTVSIEDAGPSRKKISITIPAETVATKINDSLETIAVEAALPGFRKGRAPAGLIEKRFGSTIREDAKQELIASAYTAAIEENKLKVIGEPSGETLAGLKIEEGKPLSFEIEVEVLPEFDLPSLDGIKVEKPVIEVGESTVDNELEKLCVNEGSLEEEDQAQPGDYVTGLAVMTADKGDKEFYNINGAVVQVPPKDKKGKGMILGVMVDDLGKQIGSPKPGNEISIKVTGPENHEIEELRGVNATIAYKIDRVDRIVPAEIDTLATMYGMENADQLKETAKSRLEQRALVEQQAAMRSTLTNYLLENTTMEMPERATAQQAARTLERRRMELMHRGVPANEIEEHIAELRSASQEAAGKELKMFFILNKVAEDLDIKVDEAEINGRIAQIAFESNQRPEQLRQELIKNNRISSIFQQIREHKALDAVLSKADISELPSIEFHEFMEQQKG